MLENIIQNGNRAPLNPDMRRAGIGVKQGENDITCKDGFTLSVIAGGGAYCYPRPAFLTDVPENFTGPFLDVEVGFPSERPEPWATWKEYAETQEDPTGTVYGYVPAQLVRDLVALHGGEQS